MAPVKVRFFFSMGVMRMVTLLHWHAPDHTFDDTSSTVTAPPPPPRLGSSITLGGSSEAHVKHLVNATFEVLTFGVGKSRDGKCLFRRALHQMILRSTRMKLHHCFGA